jgi:hypothetical protein
VNQLIERLFNTPDWQEAGQGWEGQESRLKLTGWESSRRVVILRRPLRGELLLQQPDADGQQVLGFIEATRADGKRITGYEHAVLVTDLPYEVLTLAQLYRDRADAENALDELKYQWGWGGFTTQDIHRCQLSARAVALIYDRRKSLWDNWWSLFVRLAHPEARKEAIISRPWLLSSVGIKTEHAAQTTVKITGIHAQADKARNALMNVSALLKTWFSQAAEQLSSPSVWTIICQHIKMTVAQITEGSPPKLRPVNAN